MQWKSRLAIPLLFLASVHTPALAGDVTITKISRVLPNGLPTTSGGVYFPSRPKAHAFDLFCPSGSVTLQVQIVWNVSWTQAAGANFEGDWGDVRRTLCRSGTCRDSDE